MREHRPLTDYEIAISLKEAAEKLLKQSERCIQNITLKSILKRETKWSQNGHVEKQIHQELDAARNQLGITKKLPTVHIPITVSLDQRLADHYYESISPHILELTKFHRRRFSAWPVRIILHKSNGTWNYRNFCIFGNKYRRCNTNMFNCTP